MFHYDAQGAAADFLTDYSKDAPPEEREEIAWAVLSLYLRTGAPAHSALNELHDAGLYPDILYNRAISAFAKRRGWVRVRQTGSINMISYGLLPEAPAAVQQLGLTGASADQSKIPLQTEIRIERDAGS